MSGSAPLIEQIKKARHRGTVCEEREIWVRLAMLTSYTPRCEFDRICGFPGDGLSPVFQPVPFGRQTVFELNPLTLRK